MAIKDYLGRFFNLFRSKKYVVDSRPTWINSNPVSNRDFLDIVWYKISNDVSTCNILYPDSFHRGSSMKNFVTRPNLDQTKTTIMIELVYKMLTNNIVALVPTYTKEDGEITQYRVANVVSEETKNVIVDVYNDETGSNENVRIDKRAVMLFSNPRPNLSLITNPMLDMLNKKMSAISTSDVEISSGKRLQAFIRFPYGLREQEKVNLAKRRARQIDLTINSGNHGLGFLEEGEELISLNSQSGFPDQSVTEVTNIQDSILSLIGIPRSVLEGTADERTQHKYVRNIITPILNVISEEFTKKLCTNDDEVVFEYDNYRDITMDILSTIGDSLVRNAVLTPNELRYILGFKSHTDLDADKLYNRNMPTEQQGGLNE